MARRRGAVVIGVNKTGGGLAALESPAAGAETFGAWLKSEGFEVTTITDAAGKVEPQHVADAIAAFVRSGNCHQLVIYFSGHGFWKNETELWLLTDAPNDANAAISWTEAAEFAKDCGIPNVVLISDACRSIPDTPQKLRVRGTVVFPNDAIQRSRAKIDKFMAATVGRPAYEIPMGAQGEKQSAFTHCFLRAFQAPDPEMIQIVTEGENRVEVVPNRRLGKYLQRELAALLASVDIKLDQAPDAEVLSDDDAYIGRARATGRIAQRELFGPRTEAARPAEVSLRDVAAVAVARAIGRPPPVPPQDWAAVEALAQSSGFNDSIRVAREKGNVSQFETDTGFVVVGASVTDAMVTRQGPRPVRGKAHILEPTEGKNTGIVRVHLDEPACGVALKFGNGRGTALAALQGFICHVRVERNGVVNVSYVPAENSWRWGDYAPRGALLADLRAAAAAAARHGVFRLDDRKRAAELAQTIRIAKGLDPSLGLYAAYAYAEADRRDDVESVGSYMEDDLRAELFDVTLLARKLTRRQYQARLIVPFCPMLTQGWNLLRAHRITLPKVLEDAQDELEPALWTTFKPARIQLILDALQRGEL